MTTQSHSQKIGAIGHKWAMFMIQSHPDWLSRDLSEDFGVDAEAELTESGVNGEILKLQFKSSESIKISQGKVRFSIDRKYFDYANVCRYPVVFITIDTVSKQVWYLWLQDWLLKQRYEAREIISNQKNFTVWVKESQTLLHGLNNELKEIAKWRGNTQLVLSLLDAMRAGAATQSTEITNGIVNLIVAAEPNFANATLDIILEETVLLGQRMRGTQEGINISQLLFNLIRRFGDRISATSVDYMVRRGDGYSRTGIIALGILYDEFFKHTASLSLVKSFQEKNTPHVAYYCALREKYSQKKYIDFINGAGDFCFGGLKFEVPLDYDFSNAYANRGPSAILDFLKPIEIA